MGVPTFYRWLCIKYPKVVKDAAEERQVYEAITDSFVPADLSSPNPNGIEFDNLYIDMNGVVHPCCHPEDAPAPLNESEMFQNVCDYIDRIVNIVRPRKLIYLALDGVAPRAKMNQQRSRRYKAANESAAAEEAYEELKAQFESEGREVPPQTKRWDSNVITPGTPFMDRLAGVLRFYVAKRMEENTYWRKLAVLVSDSNVPGEGEHKVMSFVRSQRQLPNYDPNTKHVMHGMDADLIMLGLATHEANFYIIREVVMERKDGPTTCAKCGQASHKTELDCPLYAKAASNAVAPCPQMESTVAGAIGTNKSFRATWKSLQFLQLSVLREYLQQEFTFPPQELFSQDKETGQLVKVPNSIERHIDDFVLMCFFVGNDFLPHLPSLSIHKGSIDQMLALYKAVYPSLGDYLTCEGFLNLEPLRRFTKYLADVEPRVFEEENKRKIAMARNKDRYRAQDDRKRQANEMQPSTLQQRPPPPPPAFGNQWSQGHTFDPGFDSRRGQQQQSRPQMPYDQRRPQDPRSFQQTNAGYRQEHGGRHTNNGTYPIQYNNERVPPPRSFNDNMRRGQQDSFQRGPQVNYQNHDFGRSSSSDFSHGHRQSFERRDSRGSDASSVDSESSASLRSVNITQKLTMGDPSKSSHQESVDNFREALKKTLDAKNEVENPQDDIQLGVGDPENYRRLYYQKKFHLHAQDDLEKTAEAVSVHFIRGMQWVLLYYYQGVQSWEWYFPFHYAPLGMDLYRYGYNQPLKQNGAPLFKLGVPFNPLEQLLANLPPRSAQFLPEPYAELMTDPTSSIADFYPLKFHEDPDGKRFRWQWVAQLPFIDPDRLKAAAATKKHLLDTQAAKRNAMGDELLFLSSTHPAAKDVKARVSASDGKCITLDETITGLGGAVSKPLRTRTYSKGEEIMVDADGFTPFKATCLALAYDHHKIGHHKSELIPGVISPPSALTPDDFIKDPAQNAQHRRGAFNSNVATRMIMQVIGGRHLQKYEEQMRAGNSAGPRY